MTAKQQTDVLPSSVLVAKQRKTYGPTTYMEDGTTYSITARVRHDDECGNGHNTFSITAEIREHDDSGRSRDHSGGCLHEDVAKRFPELARFIKWHLTSTDGPMHYLANTLFLAGDRDCHGRAAGEPCGWSYGVRFGDSPVTHMIRGKFHAFLQDRHGTGDFQVAEFTHERDPKTYGKKYTILGFGEKWHHCPFNSRVEADEFCQGLNECKVEFVKLATDHSPGKPRDLEAARHAAVWPDATDEELSQDRDALTITLSARLRDMMTLFRRDVESLGFTY